MYHISVMNENLENNDWINEAPTLAAMGKRNPFAVPDGYFESVEEQTLSAVFLDGLKKKTNQNSFEVPQNYFEDLMERIETRISLSEMPKAQQFAVPENYFDTLQSRINNKIAAETPQKVAKIVPLWRKNMVKYASAACFVLMATFGAYFYQNNPSVPAAKTPLADLANEQLLYDIDENTIIEHLDAQNTNSSKTNSASDTEMENYILSHFSSNDLSQELNN